MELFERSALELGRLLRAREVSSREVTKAVLERVMAVDAKVRAFITVSTKRALDMADEADRRLADGTHVTPLTGVPLAMKDNMCIQGLRTTCSSKILQQFVPPYHAAVAERLSDAGAVFAGKTNMDEFAMGSSTENSAFFTTCNPWDLTRVPGGSSGGSAAAVAACEVPCALGSDTGGSIRQPAALCGISGLKPTYGRVSRYGLVAYASSLDQIGPLARDVRDIAALMNVIAGHDGRDSTSAPLPVPDYLEELEKEVKGVRIGLPVEFFTGLEPAMAELIRQAARVLEQAGAVVEEVALPHIGYALPAYYIIAPAEASSNLARYDGARYGLRAPDTADVVSMFKKSRSAGFGAEVRRRIMIGTYALSSGYYDAYYLKAQKARTLISRDFEQAFHACDVILAPTTPTPAFTIGEKAGDPLQMYLADIYTVAVNLAGLPGLVIPCGFLEGLPVGLQLIGRPFDEALLLCLGSRYQGLTEFHRTRPTAVEFNPTASTGPCGTP